MCCRYYVESSERTRELVAQMPPSLRSRWERTDAVRSSGEINPTDVAPVIAPNSKGERAVYPMKWGYAMASLVINARVESAAKKPSFADGWKSHRCIIPATYYYEWEHLKDMQTGKEKTGDKYILQTKGKETTYLCGLYRIIGELPYFVILTRQPGESIRFIHDRMPLILPEEYIDDWIKPDSVAEDIIGNAITDPFFEKYKEGIEPAEQLRFL